jgi:Cd2+/Zn2+-exporting ATPase
MKVRYTISGLDCPNCANKLEGMIAATAGIDSAKINFLSEKLTVESALDEEKLLEALRKTAKAFESGITIK